MTIGQSAYKKFGRIALSACIALVLTDCSRYQLTLNEKVLYSPTPLLTDFQVEDANLQNCLDQTILDHGYTHANQLRQLSCSHAGIQTLRGLAYFSALQELNLNHNELRDLQELQLLSKLKILTLQHNQLAAIPELLSLLQLEQLDLADNPGLDCRDLWQLQEQQDLQINAPTHCRR